MCRLVCVESIYTSVSVRYVVRCPEWQRVTDLVSGVLPLGRLWYDTPDNALGYAMHSSRSHNAVIRAYDAADNMIETHEHKGVVTCHVADRRCVLPTTTCNRMSVRLNREP